MSKAFIAEIIQNSAEITGVAANRAAADLIEAIVKEMNMVAEGIKTSAVVVELAAERERCSDHGAGQDRKTNAH